MMHVNSAPGLYDQEGINRNAAAHRKANLPEKSLGDGSHGGRPPERLLLPDGARDAAGWATARPHAIIMAAHLRESLQKETELRGTRRCVMRVEGNRRTAWSSNVFAAPHGTGCELELSGPLTQHRVSGLQIAPLTCAHISTRLPARWDMGGVNTEQWRQEAVSCILYSLKWFSRDLH